MLVIVIRRVSLIGIELVIGEIGVLCCGLLICVIGVGHNLNNINFKLQRRSDKMRILFLEGSDSDRICNAIIS